MFALFDPYAPTFIENPYPAYAALRDQGRALFSEEWGVTFFSHHDDITAILRDRRFGRDVRQAAPENEIDHGVFERTYPPEYPTWTYYTRESFIDLEPPAHTRIRKLVQHAFSRRASATYRPRMELAARALLDEACDRGAMEVIADYATPIPLAMISDLMGVPARDQPRLVEWSHAMVRLFDEKRTEEDGIRAEQATIDFVAYLRKLMAERDGTGDDLVTSLMQAEIDGDRLTPDEVIATSILTLNAGHEATVQAIGNGILALARFPDQFESLRQTPGLIGTAVDELLRFDTPLQMFERWVLEDMEWKGIPLRRGTKVGLFLGSANHDDHVFEEPTRLDLARNPNPHVAFGGGIHYCVGAPLAKLELEVAFLEFSKRIGEFSLTTTDLDRVPSVVFRGVKSLPINVEPA